MLREKKQFLDLVFCLTHQLNSHYKHSQGQGGQAN